MKTVTVKDVARHAQVSVATVSRVLNGHASVDTDLRNRVNQAVEALRYRPNRLARNLRTNSTNMLAMVVPDIQNPFFVAVARGCEAMAFRQGYGLMVCNTDDDPQRETSYFQTLSDESVAGIIVCATDERQGHVHVRRALAEGIAVVALDRRIENADVDGVLSDNFGGSRQAVSYLLELGHRRIGLIAGPDRYAPGRERRMGYEQALLDHGLPIDRELVRVTDFKAEGARLATEQLLALPLPPTALFVSSGSSSLGCLRSLNQQGIRLPDDLSVIVFDDLDWAEAYNPPLTTVAQNTSQLGQVAADLLLRRVRGDDEPAQERRLPTRLNVRASCAVPQQS